MPNSYESMEQLVMKRSSDTTFKNVYIQLGRVLRKLLEKYFGNGVEYTFAYSSTLKTARNNVSLLFVWLL